MMEFATCVQWDDNPCIIESTAKKPGSLFLKDEQQRRLQLILRLYELQNASEKKVMLSSGHSHTYSHCYPLFNPYICKVHRSHR